MNKKLIDRPLLRVTAWAHEHDCVMGRFGGGWHWAFGFRLSKEAGRDHGHLLVELFTFTVHIDWGKPCTTTH